MKTIVDYAQLVKQQHALNISLAPVETDPTASSKAYAIGQHFILNGELYKAKTAIALGDALVLDTNYEAAESIEAQIENLDAENQTLTQNDADTWDNIYANGSINILENNAVTNTVNGITFTVYEDGTIKANGTSTVDYETWCYCAIKNKVLKAGSYKLSGSPSGGALNKYGVRVSLSDVKDGTATAEVTEYGDGATLTLASDKYYRTYTGVFIAARATVDNIIFKPMLTLASQPNSDYAHYVPYVKTNRELTEDTNAIEPMLNVLGAKNLLKNTASSATVYGVTFTVNSDGSVIANGTASGGNAALVINQTDYLKKGDYILSGAPSGHDENCRIAITRGTDSRVTDSGDGAEFSLASDAAQALYVIAIVIDGETVSNAIFYPMIRPASIEDDTYVPYTMTNRELTEYTSDVASDSYTKDGILVRVYRCGRQVMFLLGGTATANIAASTVLCTLDSKFVPYEVVNSIAIKGANTVVGKLNISTNGQVYFDTAISNGEGPLLTSLCYIAKNP